MKKLPFILLFILSFVLLANPIFAQTKNLLSAEESLWLKGRKNTIVVYPEQNNPPYSYQSPSGNIQGFSIDYIELIAEKLGAKIEYLTPRSRGQIKTDIQSGKGDIAFFDQDTQNKDNLLFTESYATVPVVIVVRKDYPKSSNLTLNDFNGKKVSMVSDSYAESYVSVNYPRVVREGMTDDEVSLQQLVLGEVDAAVIDVASLSFYISKQVLSSVKIAGSTGLDYKPSFAISKDKVILQSVLEKGLSQISANNRTLLIDKWINNVSFNEHQDNSFFARIQNNTIFTTFYILLGLGFVLTIFYFVRSRYTFRYFRKKSAMEELEDEVLKLEKTNTDISEELKAIKTQEEKLEQKIDSLKK